MILTAGSSHCQIRRSRYTRDGLGSSIRRVTQLALDSKAQLVFLNEIMKDQLALVPCSRDCASCLSVI
jgi:hypothetical protein